MGQSRQKASYPFYMLPLPVSVLLGVTAALELRSRVLPELSSSTDRWLDHCVWVWVRPGISSSAILLMPFLVYDLKMDLCIILSYSLVRTKMELYPRTQVSPIWGSCKKRWTQGVIGNGNKVHGLLVQGSFLLRAAFWGSTFEAYDFGVRLTWDCQFPQISDLDHRTLLLCGLLKYIRE